VVGGQLPVVNGTRAGALFQLSVVSCQLSVGQGLELCFSCRWSVVSCQWDKGWSFVFSFLSAFFRFHPSISVSLGRNLSAFQDLQKRFH